MQTKRTIGTCAKQISFKIEDGIVTAVKFHGGCDGNTRGLENLISGLKTEHVIEKLSGIDCGGRGTSCPDQLARMLKSQI